MAGLYEKPPGRVKTWLDDFAPGADASAPALPDLDEQTKSEMWKHIDGQLADLGTTLGIAGPLAGRIGGLPARIAGTLTSSAGGILRNAGTRKGITDFVHSSVLDDLRRRILDELTAANSAVGQQQVENGGGFPGQWMPPGR